MHCLLLKLYMYFTTDIDTCRKFDVQHLLMNDRPIKQDTHSTVSYEIFQQMRGLASLLMHGSF